MNKRVAITAGIIFIFSLIASFYTSYLQQRSTAAMEEMANDTHRIVLMMDSIKSNQ